MRRTARGVSTKSPVSTAKENEPFFLLISLTQHTRVIFLVQHTHAHTHTSHQSLGLRASNPSSLSCMSISHNDAHVTAPSPCGGQRADKEPYSARQERALLAMQKRNSPSSSSSVSPNVSHTCRQRAFIFGQATFHLSLTCVSHTRHSAIALRRAARGASGGKRSELMLTLIPYPSLVCVSLSLSHTHAERKASWNPAGVGPVH